MKKKRKIKIPAAVNGIEVENIDDSTLLGGAGFNTGNMMKAIPTAIDLLSKPFTKSTATSGKEAALQSVAAVGKGAAAGFTVGGPVGAIVGAGIGAIGSKGEKASMTSFTDYELGTLGTGIIGAFGNRKLRRELKRIKRNAYGNRAAVQGTQYLLSEGLEEYGDILNADTFQYGGASNSLAYVDDGELIATPDGTVSKVPELGLAVDSNIVNLPGGTRILSNTLKVPGTKKTFSELGEQMMTKKQSKGTDRFASNASKLNELNNKTIHDLLFDLLEMVKNKRGIKNKEKAIPTAEYGNEIAPLNVGKFIRDNTTNIDDIKISDSKRKELVAGIPTIAKPPRRSLTDTLSNGLSRGVSELGTLAPILSNLFTTNDKPVDAVYNPYASSIASTMGRRRFNITPAMQDVARNRATSNYNASLMNTNTGANMAYRLQSALGEDRAISNLRALESNVNNQYAADYANTLNSLGQQWVGATNLASDANILSMSNARNIRRTGLSQLSQLVLNKETMANQTSRDDAMMQLYAPFLSAGYSKSDLANLKKYLKKGGNNVG